MLACPTSYVFGGRLPSGTVPSDRLEHWIAVSTAAMAITGDIDIGPSKIVFQNQAAFELAYEGDALGISWLDSARDQSVQVFRIVNPANPELLSGNTLCGQGLPTYLTVLRWKGDAELLLTVLAGDETPSQANYLARICSGFTFASSGTQNGGASGSVTPRG